MFNLCFLDEIFDSLKLPIILRKNNQNLIKFKFKLCLKLLVSRIIIKSKVNPVFIKMKFLLGKGTTSMSIYKKNDQRIHKYVDIEC